jgi:hypothetical protein
MELLGPASRKASPGKPRSAQEEPAALLVAALNEPVFVTIDGERRKITKREAVITQLVNESAGANLRATKMLIDKPAAQDLSPLHGQQRRRTTEKPPPPLARGRCYLLLVKVHHLEVKDRGIGLRDTFGGRLTDTLVPPARRPSCKPSPEEWSPQITIGTPMLIPESYVADLGVRLGLYRRIAAFADRRETDGFAAELIDRFGPLPPEVENLLEIIAIKRACREAGVERVEAGPKGTLITLRGNRFANPAGLVELIQRNAEALKLRPDQKMVYLRNWEDEKTRLAGVAQLLRALVKIARSEKPDADVAPPPTPELVKPKVARRARYGSSRPPW